MTDASTPRGSGPESTLSESRVDDSNDMTREHRAISVATSSPNATGAHRAISIVKGAPKIKVWSALLLVVAALVSYFAVGQFRQDDDFAAQLATESEGDLTRILASLSAESTSLQEQLASLKVELANAQNSSQAGGQQTDEIQAQINALEVLAGTVPVTGPGLTLTIDDPSTSVTYDALVDAVQELRDAGAEALAINGRRIGAASAFTQDGREVMLDGVQLPRPYTLSAIGPASTMEGGLQIPGGTLDTLRSINRVSVDVSRSNSLNLPALENAPSFSAAKPVGSN